MVTESLSPREIADFRRLAALMIPANSTFDVPGADDAVIFDDILRSLGRDFNDVRCALSWVTGIAELDDTEADAMAKPFLSQEGTEVLALGRAVLQCYYRDDRVVLSLGLEPRPPFPQGHTLEQGDWSLLDPVRARPKMWRDA